MGGRNTYRRERGFAMSAFFWAAGHIGWPVFALLVFTGLWWLLGDLVWRMTKIAIRRLAATMLVGWLAGFVVIVLVAFAGR